jgi:hypothetical protein
MLMRGSDAKQLSRRALLKGLGMGAGLIALSGLSGCTWFLPRSESSVPLAPAGAGGEAARRRLAQLAREAKESWKGVLRAQNRIEHVGAEELERRLRHAKRTMLDLIEEMDRQGVTAQVDAQLQALPEQFEYPEAVKQYYREEFRGVLTSGQYQQLEEYLARPGTNEPAQRVLQEGGVSSYIRKKLADVQLQPKAELRLSLTSLAALWPDWGCTAAACLAAAAAAAAICQMRGWNSSDCTHAWAAAVGFCLAAFIFCD